MEKLLPDQLKTLWHAVEQQELSSEAFTQQEQHLLAQHRATWEEALVLDDYQALQESLLAELASYTGCADITEIQRRCEQAVGTLKEQWHAGVNPTDRRSIEQFYDASEATLYELMGWHTLADDLSPLAYVTALDFARQEGCQTYLDFGAGVGSGGILFSRHGFAVTLADISSTLLRFSQWRLNRRGLSAAFIDLKAHRLPQESFDIVTAMDVFEHLVDPVDSVEHIWRALKPGGFFYARIDAESNEDRPQHIVQDFMPTFDRMDALGLVEVWRDEWLWGHRVFKKT